MKLARDKNGKLFQIFRYTEFYSTEFYWVFTDDHLPWRFRIYKSNLCPCPRVFWVHTHKCLIYDARYSGYIYVICIYGRTQLYLALLWFQFLYLASEKLVQWMLAEISTYHKYATFFYFFFSLYFFKQKYRYFEQQPRNQGGFYTRSEIWAWPWNLSSFYFSSFVSVLTLE